MDNNIFRLRDVMIPTDKLITIALDLKDGRSASAMFKLPQPQDNISDLGEVLIEVKPPTGKSKAQGGNAQPQIVINNTNIQNNH